MNEMEKTKILFALLVLSLFASLIPVAYADTTIYNVGTPESDVDVLRVARIGTGNTGADIVVGEEVTSTSSLKGQSFNQIKISLRKEDSSTSVGSVYAGVWSSTATPTSANRLKACGSLAVSGIATSATFYTFSCGSAYTIPSSGGVVIGVYYADNTIASKFGLFTANKAGTFNSTSTRISCFASNDTARACAVDTGSANSWIDSPTYDLIMNLTLTDQSASDLAFCQDPSHEDLLRCKLEAQGGALGNNFTNNPFDISNSSSNILIQTGFLSGDDTNPKTNGTGFLILMVGLIIANTLLYIGTGGEAFTKSNIFLPALISLVLIAGFTIANLVDPVILIISIVALVALSAPKILSIIASARGSE